MITREYFNYDKAVDACRELSISQGFYGRVLDTLLEFNELQIQKFNDEMNTNSIYDIEDFVMYILLDLINRKQDIENNDIKEIIE